MKPGIRTTEFWLVALAVFLGALMASGALADGPALRTIGAVQTTLVTLGYTYRRTIAKGKAKKDAAP